MGAQRIAIFDTTLRDGEQSPGCSMNLDEKLQMARQLEALEVDVIEAGFPVASDDDFAAVQAIARECRRPIIANLGRWVDFTLVLRFVRLQNRWFSAAHADSHLPATG